MARFKEIRYESFGRKLVNLEGVPPASLCEALRADEPYVGQDGIEPSTSTLACRFLQALINLVEPLGFEPRTSTL